MKEMSTQTCLNNEPPEKKRDANQQNEKLAFCLLEVFVSMLKSDPITKKCALISKVFSDHLGITITKENLLSSIRNPQSNNKPTQSPIIQSKSLHNRKNDPQKS